MKKIVFSFLSVIITMHLQAQSVKILTSGTKTSLRGLSVVSDKIVWASGSAGMVAKSVDAGATWKWITVKGFEKKEFRDIEAFDANTAIIMAIDSPAFILKTIDGGENWKTVYRNDTKGMFLDAMDFLNQKKGVVVGDPIKGKFFIARTNDRGNTWKEDPINKLPVADSGEACFASSGTNIRKLKKGDYIFVSGGLSSHLYIGNMKTDLPILQGKESTGANSVAAKNKKQFIVVGGDFTKKDSTSKNCLITKNAGKDWLSPSNPPYGYRSCIEYIENNIWLACGLNGVDITRNDGSTFTKVSSEGFHVLKRSKNGKSVFFAGNNGRIAIYQH